jgi:hypothetical protein
MSPLMLRWDIPSCEMAFRPEPSLAGAGSQIYSSIGLSRWIEMEHPPGISAPQPFPDARRDGDRESLGAPARARDLQPSPRAPMGDVFYDALDF